MKNRSIHLILLLLFLASAPIHGVTESEEPNLTPTRYNSTARSIILPSQADPAILFIDNFEYNSSLEDNGYEIEDVADPNMIAETSTSAAFNGLRGLHLRSSNPNGAIVVHRPLNLPYTPDLNLSLYVYNLGTIDQSIGTTAAFRITFISAFDQMSLDYGQWPSSGWASEDPIYNIGIVFPFFWYHLERNLGEDIQTALNAPNSPLSTFTPDGILEFNIFQDQLGTNENYFDDIAIIGPPDTSPTTTSVETSEDQLTSTETSVEQSTSIETSEDQLTSTETSTNVSTMTITRSSGPSDSANTRTLAIIFLAIFGGGALYYTRRPVVSKPPADPESFVRGQETDETRANISINFCGNCGSPISGHDPFCGECGARI
ncbi:MAG: zinc ribbon domain-containing protein [Candidatus Heimdallarchaeota archaeon]|nr:zinc ribbon domain-containing protein [Candidatus Heimdallarchaeota archaeon]